MKPQDFKESEPKLNLFDYFNGNTTAWGIFEDRFGNIRRQFQVDIEGRIQGDELILDERFHYDDGEKDQSRNGRTTTNLHGWGHPTWIV